jgi:gluconolactonase
VIGLDELSIFAEGVDHSEGIAWDPFSGHVYAGGELGELYRIDLDGRVEQLASTGGWMLGLAVDGDGRVYACDHGNGTIARLDPVRGSVKPYGHGRGDRPFDTPNVAAFGPSGSLYVTCSGEAGHPEIARIDRSGVIETWTIDVPAYPNGCVVLPDESALLVVEAKAERVVRVPINADGSAGSPETFVELPDTDADGLALDADGDLWITLFRPDGLVRVGPSGQVDGRLDDHLATALSSPTNLAFVGTDLRRAVVANVGGRKLLEADLGVAGQPLCYPTVDA